MDCFELAWNEWFETDGGTMRMSEDQYITLREKTELMSSAAEWFHSKWRVPTEAYLE